VTAGKEEPAQQGLAPSAEWFKKGLGVVTEGRDEVNILHIKWLLAFPAVLLAAGAALAQDFTVAAR
jgi:hypothetical protein